MQVVRSNLCPLAAIPNLHLQARPVLIMDREYDIFERLPNGQVLWRMVVSGRDQSLDALRKLAKTSTNEVFAVHVPTKEVIGTLNRR